MEHRAKAFFMLQQFTWQQFLVASLILTLIWYAVIVLLYFRYEAKNIIKGTQNKIPQEPLPHSWDNEVDQLTNPQQNATHDLMGKSKFPEGISVISSEEFSFGPDNSETQSQKLGLVPDVLEEIKRIFKVLSQEDGSKTDFLNLMNSVKESYPEIAMHPNISSINQFIVHHAPFHLSKDDLEALWL
jgi:hypothetical protein